MIPWSPFLPAALAQDDLRPLKPAIDLPGAGPWWPWALVAVLAALAALAAWLRWRTRRTPSPQARLRSARDAAGAALDDGRIDEAIDGLLAAIRAFVDDTTDIPARVLPVEELRPLLEARLPEDLFARIDATLTAWEALRFAGAPADPRLPDWIDDLIDALVPSDRGASPERPQVAS